DTQSGSRASRAWLSSCPATTGAELYGLASELRRSFTYRPEASIAYRSMASWSAPTTVMFRSRPIRSNSATASVRCCLPRLRPSSSRISSSGRSVPPASAAAQTSLTAFSSIWAVFSRRLVGDMGCRLGRRRGLGKFRGRAFPAVLLIEAVELGRDLLQLGLDALGHRGAVGRRG